MNVENQNERLFYEIEAECYEETVDPGKATMQFLQILLQEEDHETYIGGMLEIAGSF